MVGQRQDATGQPSTDRVNVQEAAERLGTTVDAIRKRVQRGTIAHEKAEDGRVWILLDADRTRQDTDQVAAGHRQDTAASRELVEELRDRLRFVERQLEAERQAHAESRRIIGGLVQRIPELEAPSPEVPEEAPTAPRGSPTAATEQPGRVEPQPQVEGAEPRERSWWQRWFGT